MGLAPPPDPGGDAFDIWPDNAQVWEVFRCMTTQWHLVVIEGQILRTGLRYEALPGVWRGTRTPPADRPRVFCELREMELAALEAFSA